MLLEGGFIRGGAYNWMCFFVYKGTGLQLGNLVPRALFPGENRLGDEVAGDGPTTGQPRSQGPLLPVPVKENV